MERSGIAIRLQPIVVWCILYFIAETMIVRPKRIGNEFKCLTIFLLESSIVLYLLTSRRHILEPSNFIGSQKITALPIPDRWNLSTAKSI